MPGTGISPATPSGVVAGTPFVFTGALQNYTTVPSLTYSVNGGPALTLSGVTLTGWSAVIAIGTSGSTSIRVTDGTSFGTTGSFTVDVYKRQDRILRRTLSAGRRRTAPAASRDRVPRGC